MKFIDYLAILGFFLFGALVDAAAVFGTGLDTEQKVAVIALSTFALTVLAGLYVLLCNEDYLE